MEPNICVLEHIAFCTTIGDESADIGHHEPFAGSAWKRPAITSDVASVPQSFSRLVFASNAPRGNIV
jgi:hypothetical protein